MKKVRSTDARRHSTRTKNAVNRPPARWVLLVMMAGCGAPDEAANGGAVDPIGDAAIAGDLGPLADGMSDDGSDARSADATFGDQGAVDAGLVDARPPSGLPFIPGPPAGTFDCSAEPGAYRRRASSPMGCVLDTTCPTPLVVGHRGAGGQFSMVAPENSMAGLRAAALMGLDGVELDVRHTADDALVVLHDTTVDRTTFGVGRADEMTLDEVTALALRPEGHPDLTGDFSCERVPTLAEAFEFVRGRFFVDLDVKTDRVELVVDAIVAADLIDQVFFSTGDVERARAARLLEPRLRIQIRPDTVEAYAAAMARFDRPPEVVEIPPTQIDALAADIHANGQRVFVDVFGFDAQALVTGEPEYGSLYERGADILQSEFPHLVLQSLGR